MSLWAAVCFVLAADAWWNQKPPEAWSVEEVREILESSPWARTLEVKGGGTIRVHLASALPMREAEKRERTFDRRTGAPDGSFAEYLAMIEEGKYLVLAVRVPADAREAFSDAGRVSDLQKDSRLRAGKKSHPLVTFFPPSSSDPYLRLVFDRPTSIEKEKSLDIEFVVPGISDPYRRASFYTKELRYRDRIEY